MEDISEVLHFIQKTLKAPKNQRNTFGNYNFRSCEDIVEAVKAILPEKTTLKLSDEIVMLGNRYYVKATASLCFAGACESATAYAREAESRKGMDDGQLTGATSSYARKYALNGLFMIDDTKDADATNDHGKAEKPEPKPEPKPDPKPELTPAQKQVKEFLEKCKRELAAITDMATLEMWEGLEEVKAGREIVSLPQKKWLQDEINKAKDRINPPNESK